MDVTNFMSILGIVVSTSALVLGVVNYQSNITLARRNFDLTEKKIANEELSDAIKVTNKAVEELIPIACEVGAILGKHLTDLYRSVNEPTDANFTSRPIAHHFSDLALAITDEIITSFETSDFLSKTQKQIRILNIVPSTDIFPYLNKGKRSGYWSFSCLDTRYGAMNFAALCEVKNSGFKNYFKKQSEIKELLNNAVNQSSIEKLMKAMRKLIITNNIQIYKFKYSPDFYKTFHVVNNLLILIKDEYDFGLSERQLHNQDLDVGYAVYFMCKLQLLKSTTDNFLNKFEPLNT